MYSISVLLFFFIVYVICLRNKYSLINILNNNYYYYVLRPIEDPLNPLQTITVLLYWGV